MDEAPQQVKLRTVIPEEQLQKRVKELARQISDDYKGTEIEALAILENSFMFMADLVRQIEMPVMCQFIKPRYRRQRVDSPSENAGDIFQP